MTQILTESACSNGLKWLAFKHALFLRVTFSHALREVQKRPPPQAIINAAEKEMDILLRALAESIGKSIKMKDFLSKNKEDENDRSGKS